MNRLYSSLLLLGILIVLCGCIGGNPVETDAQEVTVTVQYQGEWKGSIGGDGSTRSVDGEGRRAFSISGSPNIVAASIQKRGNDERPLTVTILVDGHAIARQETTSGYGVVSVSSDIPPPGQVPDSNVEKEDPGKNPYGVDTDEAERREEPDSNQDSQDDSGSGWVTEEDTPERTPVTEDPGGFYSDSS